MNSSSPSFTKNNNEKKENENSSSPTTVPKSSNSNSNLNDSSVFLNSKRFNFLNSFSTDKIDYENEIQFIEMNRSMSAPPVEFLNSIQSLMDDNDHDGNFNSTTNDVNNLRESSITNDPNSNYAAFFYSNSRFDPRLPLPNFYSPGQSWQMWPSSASATGGGATSNPSNGFNGGSSVIGGNFRPHVNLRNEFESSTNESTNNNNNNNNNINHRKKLVDMIQEDFPRTPSPVHTNLVLNLNSTENENENDEKDTNMMGIHLLTGKGGSRGDSIHKRNVIGIGSKKPFSISGSVDAVMAAAIEAENNEEISFGIEKLNLSEQEEFDHGNGKTWNNRNNVMEPFNFSDLSSNTNNSMNSNYTPYVPIQSIQAVPEIIYDYTGYVPKLPIDSNQHQQNYRNTNRNNRNNYHNQNDPEIISPYQLPIYESNSSPQAQAQNENLQMIIMEDFRMNKSKRYELIDLKGMMIDFSTDQHGSRFIQQKLENCSDFEKATVFDEIYPVALQLMTDVFGNYVIQKFFEYGSQEQRVALALLMHGHVLTLSLQMYGCRVVQKALENVPSDEQICLVKELEGHVLRCVKDQNGNHVIQKCIECVPLNTNAPFLTASFLSQASHLAMHPYGCRVIQRIFEHGPPEHSRALLDELLKNTGTLIQDQYGNYVVQHVLEFGKPSERSRIIQFLQGRILEFSRHKFASNVVEKCVSFGNESERKALVNEVITPILKCEDSDDSTSSSSASSTTEIPLHLMIRDQFANYVVQKMLEVVDGEERESLLQCIKPQLFQLKKYTYGKHILVKVEKMLGLPPSQQPVESMISISANPTNPNNRHGFARNNQLTTNYRDREQREYHSAPNSPISKSTPPTQIYEKRLPMKPKISKNDLNEFPPLSPNPRKK